MSDIVRLKITLIGTEPAIWRRVEVPAAITLNNLHSVIQAVMGWQNYHLYQFQVGRQTIDGPGFAEVGFTEKRNITAARVGLDDLIEGNVKRFAYIYDMGDSWEHELRIEKVLPAEPGTHYPRFIDGAMAGPPEDIGGVPGFDEFLEAVEDPDHPEHHNLLDWYGGPFDPVALDEAVIKKRLARTGPRKKPKSS